MAYTNWSNLSWGVMNDIKGLTSEYKDMCGMQLWKLPHTEGFLKVKSTPDFDTQIGCFELEKNSQKTLVDAFQRGWAKK